MGIMLERSRKHVRTSIIIYINGSFGSWGWVWKRSM
jgi:hypothetical protein